MKLKQYIQFLKMGFTLRETNFLKKEGDIMTIKEILKLGEMGYSKEEIENMNTEPEVDLNAQIENLENQIKSLKDTLQVNNTRETVTEQSGEKNSNIDLETALNLLAGNGGNNGKNTEGQSE